MITINTLPGKKKMNFLVHYIFPSWDSLFQLNFIIMQGRGGTRSLYNTMMSTTIIFLQKKANI